MQNRLEKTKWIQTDLAEGSSQPGAANGRDTVVLYRKRFRTDKRSVRAEWAIAACGVYCAFVNGVRVSDPMAPGFDCYPQTMPYHVYEVGGLLKEENEICVSVSRGWYGWYRNRKTLSESGKRSLLASLAIDYEDGTREEISSDESWTACFWNCVSSDIYDGEFYDATRGESGTMKVSVAKDRCGGRLIPADGERILEHERIRPVSSFTTPKGEFVVDFGQNLTGYVEISLTAERGEVLELSHAEVLDADGNFYTANYRSAKAKLVYVCKEGKQVYKPFHTFFGFRYIRIDRKPRGVTEQNFTAVAVYSDLKRTGYISTSNEMLNRFFGNVIWGQKDNFLDIPTDCPQRDERLGWTGDAQVFCRAACYNFDCEKFYARWLRMLKCEQERYGHVPNIVPDVYGWEGFSAAWADAATVVPWEVYRAYGDKDFLREYFPVMKRHVDGIGERTEVPFLWKTDEQLGDWLGLDGPPGALKGASDPDLVATAFYARSTELVILAGRELGEDTAEYERLYRGIRKKFNEKFPEPQTQTECVLALVFRLTDEREKIAARLAAKIESCGRHLETGFVGTPYLLYALSENGYVDLAYELLLREEYPSWLYSVRCGATTVWEHWDGRNEKGEFWSPDMNSFNHYAYGSAVDWIYGVAAGITPEEAGYGKIRIAPRPTDRLDRLDVCMRTRVGEVSVQWRRENGGITYLIRTPADSVVVIDGETTELPEGEYIFKKGNVADRILSVGAGAENIRGGVAIKKQERMK